MTKYAQREQISELDRLAMEEFGLDILQMMEAAGNKFALIVKDYLKDLKGKKILVLSGVGNNGGDGLCAARYLANWGSEVQIILAKSDLKPAARHHLKILKKMGMVVSVAPTILPKSALIVDALLGYNQQGDARPPYGDLIGRANISKVPIIAFDNPSGLEIETGKPSRFTIKAEVTVTLAVIKKGLIEPKAKKYVGKIYLVDLGIPRSAYVKVGLEYPFEEFTESIIH